MTHLKEGIPNIEDYRALVRSQAFAEMECFSNHFLQNNRRYLRNYGRRWIDDPLHQWSRQWEYPFVASRIREHVAPARGEMNILDAGSGITFFPYYLDHFLPHAKLHCCDQDSSLAIVYRQINMDMGAEIKFRNVPIGATRYPDDMFESIYCVSVLEHTHDYATILKEFKRILKPGGLFVSTFDISIDGHDEIDIDTADCLLEKIYATFDVDPGESRSLNPIQAGSISTLKMEEGLAALPWRGPKALHLLKCLLSGRPRLSWPPHLTVYCMGIEA